MSTLTTLRASVAAELGLDNSVSGDQGLIDNWLNQAVIDVLMRTRCYVTTATMTETSGTGDYTLDTGILAANKAYVTSSGTDFPLEPMSIDELIDLRMNATSESPARFYAVQGTLLSVYPTPSAADTITVFYTPRPTAMSSGTHDPSSTTYGGIPAEFHDRLEWYAYWRGATMSDDASSGQGERYRQIYAELVREMKRQLTHRFGAKLPRARVGRRSGISVHHDNSRYP